MAEEGKNDKYIICSKCRSKYINDEEHIANDFGYTRLEMRYKTCVRCRARNTINYKTYHEKHLEQIKVRYESQKEEAKEYRKQYREKNADMLKEYERARDSIKVNCPNCNCEVVKRKLNRHLQSQKCKSYVKPIENRELELSLKFINSYPFPSFKYVSNLVHHDLSLWAEYSKKNHICVKIMYERINDKEIVKSFAERIGNFRALQAAFYILQHVMRENTGGDPINAEAFYMILDKFKLHVEGVHGWLN